MLIQVSSKKATYLSHFNDTSWKGLPALMQNLLQTHWVFVGVDTERGFTCVYGRRVHNSNLVLVKQYEM